MVQWPTASFSFFSTHKEQATWLYVHYDLYSKYLLSLPRKRKMYFNLVYWGRRCAKAKSMLDGRNICMNALSYVNV